MQNTSSAIFGSLTRALDFTDRAIIKPETGVARDNARHSHGSVAGRTDGRTGANIGREIKSVSTIIEN